LIIERISSRQFTWLIVSVIISTSSILIPGIIIFNAKQNTWLALPLATAVVTAGLMLNLSLAKRFPGQAIFQYAQIILGPWLGKLVGLFYGLTSLYMAAICLSVIAQLIKITILQETPLWPLVLGLSLLAVYSVWLGIEPITRANDLIFPFTIILLLSPFLMAISEGKVYRALPVFQLNYSEILKGAFPGIACLAEVFFILILAPAINKPEELQSASLKGLLLAGVFMTVVTQTILFVLGIYRASVYLFPLLRIAEEINILDIFERFETIVLAAWLLINSIKLGVFTYCYAICTAEAVGRKNYRPILLPALIALPLIALAPRNFAETTQVWLELVTFKILTPTAFFILPGLLLIIAKVKNRHA
jgi:spore germination protein KB